MQKKAWHLSTRTTCYRQEDKVAFDGRTADLALVQAGVTHKHRLYLEKIVLRVQLVDTAEPGAREKEKGVKMEERRHQGSLGLPGLAFSRPKSDEFGLFYIGWPGHFLEFIKYLAFFKVYRRFYSKIKTFFLF